jgi:site-specific DNA-methyltransferase (adenine-specific)
MKEFINKVFNEDCLKVLKRIPTDSVDLIVTDPPYQIDNTSAGGGSNLSKSIQNMNNEIKNKNLVDGFDLKILDELVRINKNINMYFFCNKAQIPMYLDYFVNKLNCSFDLIKWVKGNATPLFNNKYLSDTEYGVYVRKNSYCNPNSYEDASTLFQDSINGTDKNKYGHPTIKPLDLIRKLIRNSSKEDQIVCDPFMGSGTTAVASIIENRKYIGCELDNDFYKIVEERISEVNCTNGLFGNNFKQQSLF